MSFNSSTDAVRYDIENQAESKMQRIPLEIGIHEGEMVFACENDQGD